MDSHSVSNAVKRVESKEYQSPNRMFEENGSTKPRALDSCTNKLYESSNGSSKKAETKRMTDSLFFNKQTSPTNSQGGYSFKKKPIQEGPTIKIVEDPDKQGEEEKEDDPYEHYNSNGVDKRIITEGKASPNNPGEVSADPLNAFKPIEVVEDVQEEGREESATAPEHLEKPEKEPLPQIEAVQISELEGKEERKSVGEGEGVLGGGG